MSRFAYYWYMTINTISIIDVTLKAASLLYMYIKISGVPRPCGHVWRGAVTGLNADPRGLSESLFTNHKVRTGMYGRTAD